MTVFNSQSTDDDDDVDDVDDDDDDDDAYDSNNIKPEFPSPCGMAHCWCRGQKM